MLKFAQNFPKNVEICALFGTVRHEKFVVENDCLHSKLSRFKSDMKQQMIETFSKSKEIVKKY
jgi:hypothetical protein